MNDVASVNKLERILHLRWLFMEMLLLVLIAYLCLFIDNFFIKTKVIDNVT